MASLTGANSKIVLVKATTHGTAVQGGANSRLEVNSYSETRGATSLKTAPIGAGNEMYDDSDVGSIDPKVTFDTDMRFDGPGVLAEGAIFLGESVTANGAAYAHSYHFTPSRFNAPLTTAFEPCAASVVEYASLYATKCTIKMVQDAYATQSMEFLADNQVVAGTVNTNASMASATLPTTKKVILRATDKFRINAQTGAALADADAINIKDIEIAFTYGLAASREVKNAAGNNVPMVSAQPPFGCTVKVTLKDQVDLTWLNAARNGNEYKADLWVISNWMVAAAIPYTKIYRFPRLKLETDPDWDLKTAGTNPVVLTFNALVAPSIPAGMYSVYPAPMQINGTATAFFT